MKAEELHNACITMPEQQNREVSHPLTILNSNRETSSTTDAATENGDHPTPYQRLLETLQFDSKVKWELALGKRVGFYVLRGELGCGNFSRVKAGVHALTKEKVAIKILDKKKMDKKTKRLLCREISSMEKLHHPNIVHLYEVIHTDAKLHLVMEYASGGELFTKLSTQGMMNEADAKIIFAQIVSAVQHMHQHNVIHRDLKAENVFYSEKKHVKVGDFGFSTEAQSSKQALNTFCGSPPYAAPELFRDSFYYGESVDIWALGIILYFAVTGTMPFRAETVGKLKKRILSGEFSIPSHVSSDCKSLIRSILKLNPSARFSMTDIKSSDWLAAATYPNPMGYFRLEPTQIDLNQCLPEEAYALCHMERLGLGRDQLKKFHFPNGSSQSPFSWDSKLESSNSQIPSRKNLFSGSRSSQSNLQDQIEINENSALVGTYRILLLRGHKRFAGPSADEELRRLRALTSHVKSFDSDQSSPQLSCSLCKFNSSRYTSPHSSANQLTVTSNGLDSAGNSVHFSTPDLSGSITSNLSHFQTRSLERKRKNVALNGRSKISGVKSKFCVIL